MANRQDAVTPCALNNAAGPPEKVLSITFGPQKDFYFYFLDWRPYVQEIDARRWLLLGSFFYYYYEREGHLYFEDEGCEKREGRGKRVRDLK